MDKIPIAQLKYLTRENPEIKIDAKLFLQLCDVGGCVDFCWYSIHCRITDRVGHSGTFASMFQKSTTEHTVRNT